MIKFQVEFWTITRENSFDSDNTSITLTQLEKVNFENLKDMLKYLKKLQVPYQN